MQSSGRFALVPLFAWLALAPPAWGQAPGGFIEKTFDPPARLKLSASEIQAFLPARGAFTFPAPLPHPRRADHQRQRLRGALRLGGGFDPTLPSLLLLATAWLWRRAFRTCAARRAHTGSREGSAAALAGEKTKGAVGALCDCSR